MKKLPEGRVVYFDNDNEIFLLSDEWEVIDEQFEKHLDKLCDEAWNQEYQNKLKENEE